jgi:hypothetical protein
LKRPEKGAAAVASGQNTRHAKYTARLTITPTTAAVMAVSGAVSLASSRVPSTSGPPARMKRNDGRKVKNVATQAPATAAASSASAPSASLVHPPRKPTNATTMMSGPGVVSPSARPSIICAAVSQPLSSTAPCST